MYKQQKLDYQQNIEKYLEENHVYDMFEYLMKGLLKEKPKDPIAFMISKLENPERILCSLIKVSETDLRNGTSRLQEERKSVNFS